MSSPVKAGLGRLHLSRISVNLRKEPDLDNSSLHPFLACFDVATVASVWWWALCSVCKVFLWQL